LAGSAAPNNEFPPKGTPKSFNGDKMDDVIPQRFTRESKDIVKEFKFL
jgi:hypothetical protein